MKSLQKLLKSIYVLLKRKYINPLFLNYEFKITHIDIPKNILHYVGYLNNQAVIGWNIGIDEFFKVFKLKK